jgi:hypothetical protein
MKKISDNVTRFGHFYALFFISVAALIIARYILFPKNFDWPAWVQAIGSIAAILVAVLVSSDQAEQQRQRDAKQEKGEIAGVLRSILAETQTTMLYMSEQVRPHLNTQPDQAIRTVFALPDYPFPIFDALIPKLGVIPSAGLQMQIIQTFAYAKSLSMTAKTHNGLVENLIHAELALEERDTFNNARERTRAIRELLSYDKLLCESYDAAWHELENLVSRMNQTTTFD